MKFFKLSAAALLSISVAPAAMAAEILIDDFSDFQEAADAPTAATGSTSLVTGSTAALGGSRFFEVTNTTAAPVTPGSGGAALTSTGNGQLFQQTPEDTLTFVTGTSQTGSATVIYDGRADAGTPSTFAPVDLTDGGTNQNFFFDLVQDTPNFVGTSFITTVADSMNSFTFTENLDATFSPFTNFSNFVGIDFTDIVSLAFTFDTNDLTGFDGGISSISVVPLPLTTLLLLGGLGGLAGASAVSKRRAAKNGALA